MKMKINKIELTQKELKELINYDPITGIVTNKKQRGCITVGKELKSLTNDYYHHRINGTNYPLHRLIMFYMLGSKFDQDLVINHIDENKTNNKWCNLEVTTTRWNNIKVTSRKTNTSGVKGVSFDKVNNKWKAQITVNYKGINLGRYKDFDDAVAARKQAEIKYGY